MQCRESLRRANFRSGKPTRIVVELDTLMKSRPTFSRLTMQSIGAAVAGFICTVGSERLQADELSMRGYYLESFSAEKGLPQNTVADLWQTHDGYLWIVTPFGLARFDGVSFKTFTPGNTPGLRENMFTSLAEDEHGVLWAGTRDGLLRYQHGTFERLDTSHGLPDTRIDGLCRRRQGGIWAATAEGIAHVSGRKGTTVVTNASIRAVFEDSLERLWFSQDTGVYIWNSALSKAESVLKAERRHEGRVTSFCEDRSGTIWFGTKYGLHRWRDGKLESFSLYGEDVPLRIEEDRAVRSVLEGPNPGQMWVALDGVEGLYLFCDQHWFKASLPEWPVLRRVRRCIKDVEGNFWLGTDTHGLLRLRYPRLQVIGKEEGLPNDCIWSVSASSNGGIWAGGEEGFSRIGSNGEVTPFRPPEHWSDAIIRSVLESKSGDLLLGDHLHGLYRLRDGNFDITPMPQRFARTVYEDRSGTVWVGTHDGMARVRGSEVRYYSMIDGLPHRDVRAFLEDRSGQLWIGTYGGGVCVLSNETFRSVGGIASHKAWSLHEDAEGVIWIGTAAGLNRYENGRVFAFTRKHGLFDDLINHVVEDDEGMFWISSNRGIYRVSRKELNQVAAGKLTQVNHVAYGEADGMLTSETNGEYQPAGCKSADGRIWFPTQRGVVVIDPKTVYRNELPPPVIIEQVVAKSGTVFGANHRVIAAPIGNAPDPEPKKRTFRLKPGEADVLEIRFTANSFVEPSKVRFKHKLEGHDSEWTLPDNSRVAHYTNLRPGNYRFHVIACNNHGYWNERGDEFSFIVEPRFHETWSFYGLCAVGLVSGAAGVQAFRLRLQRKMLRLEQQEALQRERERIARDMHDDVGAKLTRIAILSEVAKHQAGNAEQVRDTAKTISETARHVVDNISEIVWLTNPKNDTLDSLAGYLRAYAAEFFDLSSVSCRLDFPAEVPTLPVPGELRRDILLAFKEALNNVAKHAEARGVVVTFTLSEATRQLSLSVLDDGKGLRPEDVNETNNGLKNMRERLSRRGGSVEVTSGSGTGTCVTISVVLALNPSTTFM
jgi:ligand-binding sensor domain-containing protein/signal transduction histidine kinase